MRVNDRGPGPIPVGWMWSNVRRSRWDPVLGHDDGPRGAINHGFVLTEQDMLAFGLA